ncbi:hypothetical protein SUDANB145_02283 [Streptomyces sp. enrichment culture]
MTTTLITGGNRGLGHEIARRLVQAGQTVWIGARDAENGRKAADRLGADFVQLNVTDDASVDAAVTTGRRAASPAGTCGASWNATPVTRWWGPPSAPYWTSAHPSPACSPSGLRKCGS